ncbi:MAG: helix-turn-helix domain-containing protein [Thiohalomonadaceae bacterium]
MQLSVRDVAQLLGVSEDTVFRWINQGRIPFHRIHRQYRFGRAELFEWAAARNLAFSPEALARLHGSTAPLPSLTAALEAGAVVHGVNTADKAALLHAAVEALVLPEDADRAFLGSILLARKDLVSVDSGDGIALPNVRSPIVLNVERPALTLLFPVRPVDFQVRDAPVHALFLLVSPTVHVHLHLLSLLTFSTRQPTVREALERRAARAALLAAFRAAEDAPQQSADRMEAHGVTRRACIHDLVAPRRRRTGVRGRCGPRAAAHGGAPRHTHRRGRRGTGGGARPASGPGGARR